MLSEDHPIKRDDLLKDIPDNKAFYPCVGARAKSHLKWAEAFWLLLGSKSNNRIGIRELLRRFGYFWAPKVTRHLYVYEWQNDSLLC
ncbi:hypothetical protein [Sphingobacterium sp.]|uniref:hypothetical protein n=1 Tax=Sphingobacterium sp. TaxID=341027 RepID=UPI0028ADC94F|nr:hypothetical protein [Sphingobacterium sp.]